MGECENLYETDVIYRPPPEADSILLEIAVGCSYSKCTFCSKINTKFYLIPLAKVEKRAAALSEMSACRNKTSLFLLGSDTFSLGMGRLGRIFEIVHRHFPWVSRINMYSRAIDVLRKKKEDLIALKRQGLGILYIGVESGSDKILERCQKGETTAEMLAAFSLLDELGIGYGLSSILGLGGRKDFWEHATRTAQLYNRTHPQTIRVMTLTAWPGTPLHEEIKEGRFTELSPGEILLEERLFLSELEVNNCLFIGTHKSNNVPLAGYLPEHKEKLLDILDEVICYADLSTVTKKPFNHM